MAYLRIIAAAGAIASVAGFASAGVNVTGSAGSGWREFPGALNDYSNTERPYWDQRSMDSGNRNIGNYLAGSYEGSLPGGAAPSPGITPQWWGSSSSDLSIGGQDFTGDPGMQFTLTGSGTSVASTMQLEVAGNHAFNEIGWYDTNDAAGAEVLHPIYGGGDGAGTSASFTPSESFGLYLRSYPGYTGAGEGWLFFADTQRNRTNGPAALSAADLDVQHFAVFATDLTPGAERYMVGVEDLPLSATGIESFGDYNDVVFTMSAVPAPGTMALLGLGGVLAGRRRR